MTTSAFDGGRLLEHRQHDGHGDVVREVRAEDPRPRRRARSPSRCASRRRRTTSTSSTPAVTSRSAGSNARSNSIARTRAPVAASASVSEPSPAPTSTTRSPGPDARRRRRSPARGSGRSGSADRAPWTGRMPWRSASSRRRRPRGRATPAAASLPAEADVEDAAAERREDGERLGREVDDAAGREGSSVIDHDDNRPPGREVGDRHPRAERDPGARGREARPRRVVPRRLSAGLVTAGRRRAGASGLAGPERRTSVDRRPDDALARRPSSTRPDRSPSTTRSVTNASPAMPGDTTSTRPTGSAFVQSVRVAYGMDRRSSRVRIWTRSTTTVEPT